MVAEPKKEIVIIEKKVRRQKITPPAGFMECVNNVNNTINCATLLDDGCSTFIESIKTEKSCQYTKKSKNRRRIF